MSASPTNISGSSQSPSVRHWVFAFFAPAYVFVAAAILMEFGMREAKEGPGGLMMVLFGIANIASLWLCLREVLRVQQPDWQRPLLIVATIFGLAVQTIVAGLFFGLLFLTSE
ncbi:MAG: hypothetical protein B9S33_00190 [Pedosphaera sp. Tous-C6FEB]|nr:MAG: hypothetical protein B9S33_00190 [Pedosphaera sp. Tous-C6FEB]